MHAGLALFFWRGDVRGLVMLVCALIGISLLQAALAAGVMFGMNRLIPDQLPEKTYGDFDFDHFQENTFLNFVIRMLIIFGGTTLGLHLLEYLVINREIIPHWRLMTFVLFVLETTGIGAGLHFVFRLDRFRLAIITAASALGYLVVFALLRRYDLLI